MRFCTNCGTSIEDDQRFCPECGTDNGIVENDTSEENLSKFIPKISVETLLIWVAAILFAIAAIEQATVCIKAAQDVTVMTVLVDKWVAIPAMAVYYVLGFWSIICAAGIILGKGNMRGKTVAAAVILFAEILILRIAYSAFNAIGMFKPVTEILFWYVIDRTTRSAVLCALSIAAAIIAGRMAKKTGAAKTVELKNSLILKIGGKIRAIIVVLAVIAVAINTLMVYLDTYRVELYDERSSGNFVICETEKYIYYVNDGLCRISKTTHETEKATRKESKIIAAEADGIYYRNSSGKICYVSDKDTEVTTKGNAYGAYAFMDGIYNYALNSDGLLMKYLNSKSGNNSIYSRTIHSGGDYEINEVKMYDGYIYAYITASEMYSDEDEDKFVSEGYKIIRISLSDGKEETIFNERINNFTISDDKIYINAYDDGSGIGYVMNINGSNIEELVEIDLPVSATLAAKDDCIYYVGTVLKKNASTGKLTSVLALQRYNTESGKTTLLSELDTSTTKLYSTSSYLIYFVNGEPYIYDYNGTRITAGTSAM